MAHGVAIRLLKKRLKAGKEDPDRWREKLGEASLPRPDGRLIWFHAASVGEALSLLDLIRALLAARDDVSVLVTTGTRSSAEILGQRLPDRAYHQFAPVDSAEAVRGFLRHWQPDVAVWVESELWPRMIFETYKSGCAMFMINARISEGSVKKLRRAGRLAAGLLSRFRRILAQDAKQADRLLRLGASSDRIEVTGSLKDTATALPYDENELKNLMKTLGGKHVWLAASTHDGEEDAAIKAHRYARRVSHGLILILVPRHPERAEAIAKTLRAEGWRVARRSTGDALGRDTEVYLADTLGEMGLWYRISPISFIGGSLARVGGHNPFEAAQLGSAILHGPHVFNFDEAYRRFADAHAAVLVSRADDLGPRLVETLPADRTAALAQAGWNVTSEGVDVAAFACTTILSGLEVDAQ